jgi:riboflavin kinase/FMN adenylyltransferase
MNVYTNINELPAFNKAVITIGTFDGLHDGHRKIISQLKQVAGVINGTTVVITFFPHPRKGICK